MNPLIMSGSDLNGAFVSANAAARAFGGTFSANAGWFILIATAGLVCGILLYLVARVVTLGSGDGPSLSSMSGNGVSDALYASEYLKRGGSIENASNQDFIREWARKNYKS